MKKVILASTAILLLLGVAAYFVYTGINKNNNSDEYISITVGYEISYDETIDYAEYGVSVYEYNLQREEISEIFRFPQNSMYPLGVYDKKSNSVYYTKERDNNTYTRRRTGDQIYVYNLDTDTDTMLTEDLSAVNYIIPVDDAVFFIAERQIDSHNRWPKLILGKVDLSNGSVIYWDEVETSSSLVLSVDRVQKRVYVAIYDGEEVDLAIGLFNSGEIMRPIATTHTICSYDYNLMDKREILKKDNMKIYSIFARDNYLLYSFSDTLSPMPNSIRMSETINLDNMEILHQTSEYFSWRGGNFSQDLKGVYSVIMDNTFTGIEYFNFETQERKTIVDLEDIANMQLMY